MNTLFAILFILALLLLVVSVIKPGVNKKTGKPFKRKDMAIGFGILALAFAILTGITAPHKAATTTANLKSASKQTTTTKPFAQPTKQVQQATPVASSTQPALPTITGYGATQNDWNNNHQADTRYDSGAVYDPTPGLGSDDRHNAKYYLVSTQNGRILTYEIRLPNQSNLAAARAEVMQEFPADAKVVWQQTADQCSQMEVSSAMLGSASVLGSKDIGDSLGQVFVEFQTDTTSTASLNSYYDASNVNLATLNLGSYSTAADAPGC
jgi:hypothetical protein